MNQGRKRRTSRTAGFSLVECVIAMVILMIVSLAIITVFNFSFKFGSSGNKRYGAMLLAQDRIDDTRNALYLSLPAGTVTEDNVLSNGDRYRVVRTIVNNDIITTSDSPGPETKKITVTVSPMTGALPQETVTLVTFRAAIEPGPNRKGNNE